MNSTPSFRLFAGSLVALFMTFGSARGYEAPNFDFVAFQRDGVFLETSDKESLLEALASVASNFPNQSKVDDDLREKALAISLRLEPLHYNSRKAHEALSDQATPESTPYFDSTSRVSETLWSTASQLLTAPTEPEEKKLSYYLMELSLALHPDPPTDRLLEYARATRGRPLPWANFTELDPIENQSTSRSESLRKEAMELLRRPTPPPATPPNTSIDAPPPGNITGPKGMDRPAKPKGTGGQKGNGILRPLPDDFEPITRSIYVVRSVQSVSNAAMGGTVSLTIREASSPLDQELLATPPGADSLQGLPLPLLSQSGGPSMDGIQLPRTHLRKAELNWTEGTVGEFAFQSEEEPPGPWRVCTMPMRAPASILLQAALTGVETNQDIIFGGGSMATGSINESLVVAAKLGRPYVLVPSNIRTQLMSYLNESQNLEVLFDPEIMMFTDLPGATTKMNSPTSQKWLSASESFAEIRAVSERMPLVDLARNAKVQERLEAILEVAPFHLSAWAMLEFGKNSSGSPGTGSAAGSGNTAAQISELMKPYFTLRQADPDLNELRQNLDTTERELSELRRDLPLELRRYQAAAEDALETIDDYLSLSNRDTSTGIQKLNQVNEALQILATERAEVELVD